MMRLTLDIDGTSHSVALLRHGTGGRIWVGDASHEATITGDESGERIVVVDGVSHRVWVAQHGETSWVHAFGRAWEINLPDPVKQASGAHDESDSALAPMPGTVVEVLVQPGDQVTRGQVLLVIESMKMQTSITAGRDGKVAEVPAAKGQSFDRGALLARLQAGEG
jgi:acetyl/propionyl-CoA carboxylase alpha subunit